MKESIFWPISCEESGLVLSELVNIFSQQCWETRGVLMSSALVRSWSLLLTLRGDGGSSSSLLTAQAEKKRSCWGQAAVCEHGGSLFIAQPHVDSVQRSLLTAAWCRVSPEPAERSLGSADPAAAENQHLWEELLIQADPLWFAAEVHLQKSWLEQKAELELRASLWLQEEGPLASVCRLNRFRLNSESGMLSCLYFWPPPPPACWLFAAVVGVCATCGPRWHFRVFVEVLSALQAEQEASESSTFRLGVCHRCVLNKKVGLRQLTFKVKHPSKTVSLTVFGVRGSLRAQRFHFRCASDAGLRAAGFLQKIRDAEKPAADEESEDERWTERKINKCLFRFCLCKQTDYNNLC